MGHKVANCWKHEENKDKGPKNWKRKEDKEVGAPNIEVFLGCANMHAIDYETDKVVFKLKMWELELQKLDKIPKPSNPHDDSKHIKGNTNVEEIKEDSLAGEKDSSGTECFLSMIEKLAIPARVVSNAKH